jgi:hypothetical protein
MALNTKNVIVGAAALFTSVGNNSNNYGRPSTDATNLGYLFPAGAPARQGLLASLGQTTGNFAAMQGGYREVGLTTTGLEISYEPSYGEVMVDQLLDAARLFKQTLKVMLKTELTEATLENLTFSWGQMDSYYVANTASTVTSVPTLVNNDTGLGNSDAPAATLNLAAGALGDNPVERVLIAVGQAPQQIGTAVTEPVPSGASSSVALGAGSTVAASVVRSKERVYVARRVVSIDTTAHGLKRDSATVFPVNFRCLPDTDYKYAGSEYGVVIDRVYGTN